jgi:hypothetical protein
MTTGTRRDRAGSVGKVLFAVNVLVYLGRCLMHRDFYEGHYSIAVLCAEGGVIVSIVALIIAVVSLRRGWKVAVASGSLIMAYLWFSDIAWWVMMK